MATINSIVMGKSRGSIGNITTVLSKSRTVARSKIVSGNRISSPLMITKQQKLTNTYSAWQYITLGKAGFKKYLTTKENYYNFFVRAFNHTFNSGVRQESNIACNSLLSIEFGYSAILQILSVSKTDLRIRVYFHADRYYLRNNTYILIQTWSSAYRGTVIKEHKLNDSDITRGYVDYFYPQDIWTGCMCYGYTKNKQFTSGIKFLQL